VWGVTFEGVSYHCMIPIRLAGQSLEDPDVPRQQVRLPEQDSLCLTPAAPDLRRIPPHAATFRNDAASANPGASASR
jgi:hypothetical protein